MKHFVSTILFSLLGLPLLFAQHQNDNWYFGNQAGMNFHNGAPTVLTGGQTATVEGTAVISDSAGNLLFYTEGVTVWNKLHNVMNNGTGLHGGNSSSQSALIIRLPGSDSLYYIFTVGEQGGAYGFEYSIVDMSLQSGNGQVILKNVAVLSNTNEQLTGIRQSNGVDYWVIVHQQGNNGFYAYQFTSAGLNNSPVISNTGTATVEQIGYMKGSHNGKKLALSSHYGLFFELYDFDNSTGSVSNAIYLGCPPVVWGPYGLEFSPNDSLLYGAPFEPPEIIQWDLSSGNAAQIVASETIIGTASSTDGGALQLAEDGKIYMAKYGSQYVSVVDSPNVPGLGCHFIDNGFSVAPNYSQAGVPNLIIEFQTGSLPPSASFAAGDSAACSVSCINFTDLSQNNPTSWEWNFPGASPSSSTDQNPTNICYNTPGTYDVTLIVTNAIGSDTMVLNNFITIFTPITFSITQNGNLLTCNPAANSYQWWLNGYQIPGATFQSLTITQTGIYTVDVIDSNGCTSSTIINVTNLPSSNFSATDTTICEKFCVNFIDESINDPVSWQWIFPGGNPATSTDQNPSNVCYQNPGVFDVTLITTDANGNSDTLALPDYITVFTNPFAPVITQNGNTLTSSSALSYQWQLNSVNIPGATNQSYTITQSGLYTVVIGDENGCNAQASIDASYVGISGAEENSFVNIFPNPSSGNFIVEWINGLMVGEVSIGVVNTLGQKVFSSQQDISSTDVKKEIDLSNFANGVYYITLQSENCSLKKKIIIAH